MPAVKLEIYMSPVEVRGRVISFDNRQCVSIEGET